ncbi:MAG: DUF5615 family PIN-like protein [Cyclobacteriaceae bacterium]|nr:DUF5615 family PIN-like protein [Cyclobacteriaceae bacterium]
MAKFLIDANLPYHFSLWNSSEYIHVKDINERWSDQQFWDFAKVNNLVIISKNADFSIKL